VNPPCKDCIVLAICKARMRSNTQLNKNYLYLYRNCCLLRDWLMSYSEEDTGPSERVGFAINFLISIGEECNETRNKKVI